MNLPIFRPGCIYTVRNSHKFYYRVSQKNMGIQWRLLYRLRSMQHFFMNTSIAVFQLKHFISKTPGLQIFKMWSTIFVISKLTEILRSRNFSLFNKSKLSYCLISSSIFKTQGRYTTVRHTASFFYFLCYVIIIRNQRRLLSRLSIPMFIWTPCRRERFIWTTVPFCLIKSLFVYVPIALGD